ncbi:MAG: hypothetical protein BZ138_08245 [Methanosphaera sp. rholeuAM270]|nr:MAG: hypothetical protein BZ138_08245 [Methanosphaera sp. rholeuAM270]
MKNKIKNLFIPLILMIIFNLGSKFFLNIPNFGGEINPHLGVLFISGLFFGPYGVIGSVIGNLICDLIRGYYVSSFVSAIVGFAVSYLAYKLWYAGTGKDHHGTNLRLNNSHNLFNFISIVVGCGIIYSLLTGEISYLFYPNTFKSFEIICLRYFVNFVNFALIFSIIATWLSRLKDFTYTPKISQRKYNEDYYKILGILILVDILINILLISLGHLSYETCVLEVVVLNVLIFIYLTKPIKNLDKISYISLPERIMDRFFIITMIAMAIWLLDLIFGFVDVLIDIILFISEDQMSLLLLLVLDLLVIIFIIPTYLIIRYVEINLVNPLISFSKLESRIKENEIIEYEDLIDAYSRYSNQKDEIGMLSRSHIELINYNNNYIENIKKVESEKQRIEAELNIAHNIQKGILPENAIDNEYCVVKGLSYPAKEVGGDFYDYYELDEDNLVIVIGDASGKGLPAAIFSLLTQNSINQQFKYEKDPSVILRNINNGICKKNSESMFITLWLGIYNKNTHKIIYANAGHNPPLIVNNGKYKYLEMDSEIVLGIMEDYEFQKAETIVEDELILYTDGITDAQNMNHELYSEKRLIEFVNNHEKDINIVNDLIDEVETFMGDEEQFDDMTLLVLKVKK